MDRAFIIGNGKSRLQFDLTKLERLGTIFGCNALYRDFVPDYLIAIDSHMIEEIRNAPQRVAMKQFIVPPDDECWEPAEHNPNRPRSNAGLNCFLEGVKLGYTDFYFLGFDFLINDLAESVSNVYDGTNGYGPEVRSTYYDNLNRVKYLTYLANKHRQCRLVFVFPEKLTHVSEVNKRQIKFHQVQADNVFGLFYRDFERNIKIWEKPVK